MNLFHISHNDLDGFGSQVMSRHFYGSQNIFFFNVNYGDPITEALDKVLFVGSKGDSLLITDLNLTWDQCTQVELLITKGIEVQLLDHHGTGTAQSEKYDWYHLDTSICATKITYEFFLKKDSKMLELKGVSDIINIYDLYQVEDALINKAKALNTAHMNTVHLIPDLDLFDTPRRNFILSAIPLFVKSIFDSKSIRVFESEVNGIQRDILQVALDSIGSEFSIPQEFLDDMSISVIIAEYTHALIMSRRNEFVTDIYINGLHGELYVGLSKISQEFFAIRNASLESDFCVNINNRGYLGFRSVGDKHVSPIAKSIGGGGHPNAAGAPLPGAGVEKELSEWKQIFLDTFAGKEASLK